MNHHASFALFLPSGATGGVSPDMLAVAGWGFAVILAAVCVFLVIRNGSLGQRLTLRETDLARNAQRLEALDEMRDALEHERGETHRLKTALAVNENTLKERERALSELKARMENDFTTIASRMLNQTHEAFLERANETFQRYREGANADTDARRKAIDEMVRPMKETLERYEKGLTELRQYTTKAQGELGNQIKSLAESTGQVQAEAAKLSTALRSGSKTRGNWGEQTLRNLVEMMGMSSYVDFAEQKYLNDEGGSKLPDMVVNLPGARVIAVDSKVSLNSYIDAMEEADEAARKLLLSRHADEVWTHVRSLAAKDYAEALRKEHSLDFVIMFLPGEHFFAAAMEMRPSLFQDAFDRKILIATPTTLIAILKSIAYGWRQEKATENAEHVAGLAQELYKAMQLMGDKLGQLGKSLGQSVKRYNEAIGNIEGTVMPKARKFMELEMPGTDRPIAEMEQIEQSVRELAPNRDMLFDDGDER